MDISLPTSSGDEDLSYEIVAAEYPDASRNPILKPERPTDNTEKALHVSDDLCTLEWVGPLARAKVLSTDADIFKSDTKAAK